MPRKVVKRYLSIGIVSSRRDLIFFWLERRIYTFILLLLLLGCFSIVLLVTGATGCGAVLLHVDEILGALALHRPKGALGILVLTRVQELHVAVCDGKHVAGCGGESAGDGIARVNVRSNLRDPHVSVDAGVAGFAAIGLHKAGVLMALALRSPRWAIAFVSIDAIDGGPRVAVKTIQIGRDWNAFAPSGSGGCCRCEIIVSLLVTQQ